MKNLRKRRMKRTRKKKMNQNKYGWKFWLKIIIILSVIILIGIGFLLGYFYDDKSCIEDPLVYGIKRLNEANLDKFTCSCYSLSGNINPFSFDEFGTVQN